MCYRDALYYQLTEGDRSQVPLCSFFNHEPAKDASRFGDKSPEEFRNYLLMAALAGTTTVETYFVVNALSAKDFDVIADGLKWLYHVSPAFKRSRMHGGSPIGRLGPGDGQLSTKNVNLDESGEVYGYTGWTESLGYVSIHNPSAMARTYSFRLDRKFGLVHGSGPFAASLVAGRGPDEKQREWAYGDIVTVEIPPRGVIVMNFDAVQK